MKKLIAIFISGILAVSNVAAVLAADNEIVDTAEKHTLTLEQTEPIKEGDDYAWVVVSEQGELANGIAVLGLGQFDSSLLGDDTMAIFSQDRVDLGNIIENFDLEITARETAGGSITVIYSDADVKSARQESNYETNDAFDTTDDEIMPRTTGSFSWVMQPNGTIETSYETKDDDEQVGYVTITKLQPTNFTGSWPGIMTKIICRKDDEEYSLTGWVDISSTGKYTLGYRWNGAHKGSLCYLKAVNGNDRAREYAGRWTP